MRELHLFEILGRKVVDSNGEYAGRLEEIEADRGDETCPIRSYLVERRGILNRITTWAITDSLQRFIPVREESKPYRVPWDQMDLSDPNHPKIKVPQSDLKRVQSS